jgi:2-polyprenyl-6-methoxyphenol hydroxylase-like FAD-dependent oxidoreductase
MAEISSNPNDVIVIGAGLAGLSAATAMVRRGLSVTLISALDHHPADFRGEKLDEAAMATFDRLGLGAAARAQMTPMEGVWSYRFGRQVRRSAEREFASDYAGLVNALAAALPREANRTTGRVASLVTGPELQHVTLNDGRRFSARLLVVATGLGDAVRRMLGVERVVLSATHSLSLGFDLVEPASRFEFPSLVWGRDRADPLLSYLTLFPIGDTMRGNLFTYRAANDPWTGAFRRDPAVGLHTTMPKLQTLVGAMNVAPGTVVRPIDVVETRSIRRDGVVLLGDAFSVVCPITGLGMAKALNDADLLVNRHLPQWLVSPGMAAAKLASFYADPDKTTLDGTALRNSLVGRRLALGQTPYWRMRRVAGTGLAFLRDSLPEAGRSAASRKQALAATQRIG